MTALVVVGVLLVAAHGWYGWERAHRRMRAMRGGLHADVTLPHTQAFELYHNAFSLCSKKARLCLAELGIPYASHHVDLIETGAYQTLGRRFLAVNPEGVVPVLVHDGHPVYQSHDQLRYMAEHAPPGAPALVPGDPALHVEMHRWVDRASIIGDDAIETTRVSAAACAAGMTLPLFAAMIDAIPTRRILEGLLFHRLRIRPLLFLTLKGVGLHRFRLLRTVARIVRTSVRHMQDHLDALEAQLVTTGGPWILGAQFTLADVSWLVLFERMVEQDMDAVLLGGGRRPAAATYWERLRARASYGPAIDAYRHPTVARGTARLRAAKATDPRLRRLLEDASPSGAGGSLGTAWSSAQAGSR
jgi:glutathione S-transferase